MIYTSNVMVASFVFWCYLVFSNAHLMAQSTQGNDHEDILLSFIATSHAEDLLHMLRAFDVSHSQHSSTRRAVMFILRRSYEGFIDDQEDRMAEVYDEALKYALSYFPRNRELHLIVAKIFEKMKGQPSPLKDDKAARVHRIGFGTMVTLNQVLFDQSQEFNDNKKSQFTLSYPIILALEDLAASDDVTDFEFVALAKTSLTILVPQYEDIIKKIDKAKDIVDDADIQAFLKGDYPMIRVHPFAVDVLIELLMRSRSLMLSLKIINEFSTYVDVISYYLPKLEQVANIHTNRFVRLRLRSFIRTWQGVASGHDKTVNKLCHNIFQ